MVFFKTTVEDQMQSSGQNHSGLLFLTNLQSGLEFVIDTGEADSEVVQVTDDFVLYRVNDRLLKSAIRGGKLLAPTELATGKEVVGTHWIFEGPARTPATSKP